MRAVLLFLVSLLASPLSAAPAYTVKSLEELAVYPQSRAVARVVPENESRIAAEVSARIQEIPVAVGQPVRKGDVLVRLDQSQYQLALEQASSQVELLSNRHKLAQLQYEQARSLAESNFISSQALEQRRTELAVLESELKIARNSVSQAQLALRRTVLRAPFPGVVRERLAGEGEMAAPSQPILTLVEHARSEVRAQVPLGDVPSLRKAREIAFRLGQARHPVKIERITPLVDPHAQTREVILRMQETLAAGVAGELLWTSTTPYLPAAYVQQFRGRLGVWVEEGGKPVFKPVPDAQTGRPVALDWPLDTRIVDDGRFALAGPALEAAPSAGNGK
ncbi:MAG TPA: efflux RND transporter periplasmic adaptor subunit [Noviherbaspirillum sp.]|nr:efflux RND transporter periplasmic adaptor subunit [Noviherbaspirillum sp.]